MKAAAAFAGVLIWIGGIACGMEIGWRQAEAEQLRRAQEPRRVSAPPIVRQLPRGECIEICNVRERMAKVKPNNYTERTGP